jgi:hypothetical protein
MAMHTVFGNLLQSIDELVQNRGRDGNPRHRPSQNCCQINPRLPRDHGQIRGFTHVDVNTNAYNYRRCLRRASRSFYKDSSKLSALPENVVRPLEANTGRAETRQRSCNGHACGKSDGSETIDILWKAPQQGKV